MSWGVPIILVAIFILKGDGIIELDVYSVLEIGRWCWRETIDVLIPHANKSLIYNAVSRSSLDDADM